jgi:MFS family permease
MVTSEAGHFVALGVFAYGHGGARAVGIAGLVRVLPAGVLAPVAATLADRFRRERFLLVVSLVGAAALIGSALAAWEDSIVPVVALAAVVGIASTLFRPALQAMLPSLSRTPTDLIRANAITSTLEGVGTLVGPLVAGALVAVASVEAALLAWAVVVAAAAVLLAPMRLEGQLPETVRVSRAREVLAGLAVAVGSGGARVIVALAVLQTFVRGCLNVLIVVAAYRLLEGGAGTVGLITGALGLGGLVGALLAARLRSRGLAERFAASLVVWGTPIALMAVHPSRVVIVLLVAIVGVANSVEDVSAVTLLQRSVPAAVLARAFGAFWGLAMAGLAVGSAVAPALVGLVGERLAFVVVGAILPVGALLAFPRLRRLEDAIVPQESLQRIDAVPMLEPLSLAAKERLAAALVPIDVVAGEVIVREGDVGDRFYLLDDGELVVDTGDRRRTLVAPDSFGEIALLRDVPRTATVTASGPARLHALQRKDFLGAVTGHAAATAAASAVVEERLAADTPA